jgi:hypothetical protein
LINEHQYNIDVIYQTTELSKDVVCLLHAKESWKKIHQEIEIARKLRGKPLGSYQFYHRKKIQSGICGWIMCGGCRRSICSRCIHALCVHLPSKYG